MIKLFNILRDNSLSIVLFFLFAACFGFQCLAGWDDQNLTLLQHGAPSLSFGQFLVSGTFIEGLSVNWQAAILQLTSLILFSSVLYQRGSPHSRDPHKHEGESRKRRESVRDWVWRHSLVLAFVALFLATLTLHILFGLQAYNEQRALESQPPLTLGAYVVSAKFWSTTLQTWQAEYLVIGLYLVLSIFLRQENSAESKPAEAGDGTTGKHNE